MEKELQNAGIVLSANMPVFQTGEVGAAPTIRFKNTRVLQFAEVSGNDRITGNQQSLRPKVAERSFVTVFSANGKLVQLVEHSSDTREVTRSNRVFPILHCKQVA